MDNDNLQLNRRRRGDDEAPRKNFLRLRNWLNLVFMIGAVAGVLLYFFADQTVGTIVILVAMVFKIVETALRFLH
ncbi:hypothetical protein [Hallella bergensis]|uniref:hypothetical protein n=1 Tax=Hallella bergensis TaxID=242750 RepID=UPI0023EFA7EE|nr:hypothetical protein [Hallella bergensis]